MIFQTALGFEVVGDGGCLGFLAHPQCQIELALLVERVD